MSGLRALLVQLAQIMMVAIIIGGVVAGFVAGGYGRVGTILAMQGGSVVQFGTPAGFDVVYALFGAVVGFVLSALSMSVLAILLDIRQSLLRIAARGGL